MLKPQKVIKQDGDSFSIHTTSTFRDYMLQFKIGEEFEEDNKGLDNRKCKVRLNNSKINVFLQKEDAVVHLAIWFEIVAIILFLI